MAGKIAPQLQILARIDAERRRLGLLPLSREHPHALRFKRIIEILPAAVCAFMQARDSMVRHNAAGEP